MVDIAYVLSDPTFRVVLLCFVWFRSGLVWVGFVLFVLVLSSFVSLCVRFVLFSFVVF